MDQPPVLSEYLEIRKQARCLVAEAEIRRLVTRIAERINQDYRGKAPIVIVVMSGAMMFAAELLKQLQFPLRLDYCHVTRYNGQLQGSDIEWRVKHRLPVAGEDVLLVDDILDEGWTLKAIVEELRQAGAASVRTVVFCEKKHERKAIAGQTADYHGIELADRYVFGFGLDYKEYGRELPAIYAVAGTGKNA
jgi:hypoxanthine phosphoribosyltransferase